jgi:hypothetical protein
MLWRKGKIMEADIGLRVIQKTALYDLLKLRRDNEKTNNNLMGLNELINKTTAVMEQEDVALVEKKIAELG